MRAPFLRCLVAFLCLFTVVTSTACVWDTVPISVAQGAHGNFSCVYPTAGTYFINPLVSGRNIVGYSGPADIYDIYSVKIMNEKNYLRFQTSQSYSTFNLDSNVLFQGWADSGFPVQVAAGETVHFVISCSILSAKSCSLVFSASMADSSPYLSGIRFESSPYIPSNSWVAFAATADLPSPVLKKSSTSAGIAPVTCACNYQVLIFNATQYSVFSRNGGGSCLNFCNGTVSNADWNGLRETYYTVIKCVDAAACNVQVSLCYDPASAPSSPSTVSPSPSSSSSSSSTSSADNGTIGSSFVKIAMVLLETFFLAMT